MHKGMFGVNQLIKYLLNCNFLPAWLIKLALVCPLILEKKQQKFLCAFLNFSTILKNMFKSMRQYVVIWLILNITLKKTCKTLKQHNTIVPALELSCILSSNFGMQFPH